MVDTACANKKSDSERARWEFDRSHSESEHSHTDRSVGAQLPKNQPSRDRNWVRTTAHPARGLLRFVFGLGFFVVRFFVIASEQSADDAHSC